MEKKKVQDKNYNYNGGYMTVFSCLLFLVMLSFIFLCLDGIMIHQADSRGKTIAVGAGEHILANYNVPLAKRYHLYFLDSEMEDKIEHRVKKYYEDSISPSSSVFLASNPLLNLRIKEIQVESFGTMQEQKCLYLKHQIREYMKYDSTKDFFLKTMGQSAKQVNGQNEQIRDIKELLDRKETAASQAETGQTSHSTLTPSEKKAGEEAAVRARRKDPRKTVRKIIKGGVLEFVTGDRSISENHISPQNLPSGSHQEKNQKFSFSLFKGPAEIKKILKETKEIDLTEEGLTCLYIKKYFNSYGKEEPIDDTVLNYEIEYILGGQESDRENLRYAVNRLMLIRFGLNSLYAFKDPELNEEALTIATALVGLTGIIPLIEGVKYLILGAVNFGETLLDVKRLLSDSKVPVLKTKSSWTISVTGFSALLDTGEKEETKGLSYEEYLILLLLLQSDKNRKYLRMQDLMQVNICQEQPGFQIQKCRFGFKLQSLIQLKTMFGHGSYSFENNRTFSY